MDTEKNRYNELFNDYTGQIELYGGRLNTDTINEENIRAQLEGYRDYIECEINGYLTVMESDSKVNQKKSPFPRIHFDYINNLEFNAVAFKHENKYFVGINLGTFLLIINYFNRILSRKDTFNEIGNAESEVGSPTFPLTNDYQNVINYYETHNDDINQIPVDPFRAEHAATLATMALDFLIKHELTHIVHGHVDYKIHDKNNSTFMEMYRATKSRSTLLPIDSQVLEFDADVNASMWAISRYSNIYHLDDQSFGFVNSYDNHYKGFIFNFSLAIWLVFRLTNTSHESKLMYIEAASHPDKYFRQRISVNHAIQYLFPSIRRNDLLEETLASIDSINDTSEHIVNLITGEDTTKLLSDVRKSDKVKINEILKDVYLAHYNSKIYNQLSEFTWVMLLTV